MTVPATLSLPVHFDRRFQFWHFQPAADLLLIRSNKHTDPLLGRRSGPGWTSGSPGSPRSGWPG